ncbi:MAG: phosphotransferase family protein, partial [Myxococcota bacterium]
MSAVDPSSEMAERLRAFVAREEDLPEAAVTVSDLRRMAGGASREIWSLGVELQGDPPRRLDLVLRRDPPGRAGEGDRELEFRLLRVAHGAGVPVPRVHWSCADPGVLETPFFLMDRVEGETIPRRLLRDERYAGAREKMLAQLAGILVRIHAIDLRHPDLAALPGAASEDPPARAELDRIRQALGELQAEPHPVLDLAERWLRARLPRKARRTLVHGDYRVGNVVFDESGVRSVLD